MEYLSSGTLLSAEKLAKIRHILSQDRNLVKDVIIPKLRNYKSQEIKALRQKICLTQNMFAKCLHISPSLVKKWEYGCRYPSDSHLLVLNLIEKHGIDIVLGL